MIVIIVKLQVLVLLSFSVKISCNVINKLLGATLDGNDCNCSVLVWFFTLIFFGNLRVVRTIRYLVLLNVLTDFILAYRYFER